MLKKYFPICLPGLFQSFLTPGPSLSALPNFPKPAYGAAPRDAGLLWLILHKSACTLGTAEPWNRAIPLGAGLNDPYGSLLAQNTLILQFLYILLLLGKKVWQRTARVLSYPHRNTLTIKPVARSYWDQKDACAGTTVTETRKMPVHRHLMNGRTGPEGGSVQFQHT